MPQSNAVVRIGFLIALCVFLGSCAFAWQSPHQKECRPWLNSFFQQSFRDRISSFKDLDPEAQYAVYICGNRVIHPPATYLAEPFAQEGAAVIPLLIERLDQAKDDLTVRDILLVFSEMSRLATYDVMSNSDLFELMKKKTREITDPHWRRMSEGLLAEIRAEIRTY